MKKKVIAAAATGLFLGTVVHAGGGMIIKDCSF